MAITTQQCSALFTNLLFLQSHSYDSESVNTFLKVYKEIAGLQNGNNQNNRQLWNSAGPVMKT